MPLDSNQGPARRYGSTPSAIDRHLAGRSRALASDFVTPCHVSGTRFTDECSRHRGPDALATSLPARTRPQERATPEAPRYPELEAAFGDRLF